MIRNPFFKQSWAWTSAHSPVTYVGNLGQKNVPPESTAYGVYFSVSSLWLRIWQSATTFCCPISAGKTSDYPTSKCVGFDVWIKIKIKMMKLLKLISKIIVKDLCESETCNQNKHLNKVVHPCPRDHVFWRSGYMENSFTGCLGKV